MVSFHASWCLLVLLLTTGAHCSMSVMNDIIPTEGEDYMLHCHGSGDLSFFMLHNEGEMLVPAEYERLQITVYQNASVYFESITMDHGGTHLCIRNSGGSDHGYQTPLKVRAHPPEDLWEEVYKPKFVTGFLAALVVAALFALGCIVHKYRWVPTDADKDPMISSSAYVNPAMVNEDTESGCSTKM